MTSVLGNFEYTGDRVMGWIREGYVIGNIFTPSNPDEISSIGEGYRM